MGLPSRWPRREAGAPISVLAHRGAAGRFRENTLEAFAAALAAGADGVELDVRRSADGVAVVHHDPEVPGAGPIHATQAAALPAWVPTLEQALESCAGALVDVEVKSSPFEAGFDPAQRLAAEVAAVVGGAMAGPSAPAAVMVSSFWPQTLEALGAAGAAVPGGLLLSPVSDAFAGLEEARRRGARALLPFRSQLTPGLVAEAHRRGLAVVPWALEEEQDLASAAEAGVDAVVTDHVQRALAVFGRA
jgi:glycerophosphoryl diester phosphodiesterase